MKLRILITSIGGHYSYDLIRAVKNEHDVYILGTDMKYNSNSHFVDNFQILPSPKKEKKYLNSIFKIIKKYKIRMIIPCSDAETIPLSKNIRKLNNIGVKIPLSEFKIIKLINNKFDLYKFLKKKNVDVGKFCKINSSQELKKVLPLFNYPRKKIILKPRSGGGSRGIIILNHKLRKFDYLLEDKRRFCGSGSLEILKKEMKKVNYKLKKYLVMPFYKNKTYDVDCIAERGKLIFCISRLRIYENPLSPINQGCEVSKNKIIEKYCSQIIAALNISGACDFDIIIRDDKKPQLLDAGCRLSGSSTASMPLGINVVSNVIKNLIKKKISKVSIKKKVIVFPKPQYQKVK